ncbi:hypothetical protein [Bacillus sp. FJAT-28004]|uniref:hypothetical protein n=1 Tax=Bacillus sp. FJAT-28004 TaxID=1679165 RepID=UPI0006B5F3E8|nr:hypothetical protein [Bacillus sp. FJAT-28004]
MEQLPKVIKEPPYFKLLNYDPLYILEKLINAQIVLIFLEAYDEETIEYFLRNNQFTIMAEVIQSRKSNDVMMSYYPHLKTRDQLRSALQNEDWGFSCIGMTQTSQHLFNIRGIEEVGEMGIKIKEMEYGLYDRFINIH